MQRFPAYLVFLLVLAACGSKPTATPDLATPVPYRTVSATPTATLIPGLTEIILPSPTPYTYTVVKGDTLSSIALMNGVTLDALMKANPGVSAGALLVGMTLIIPTGEQVPGQPSPTPASLVVKQARCWPEAAGGLWCFGLVHNPYAETLENISAQFALLDKAGGQEISNQLVYGLLDILPPGADMPLAAHFAAHVPADAALRVQVLTAIRLLPGDTRYLPVSLDDTLLSVQASGQYANLTGRVLLGGTVPASTLWLLASAYDAAGNIVGVCRWESAAALTAGNLLTFDFPVSSVGPGIARVEIIAEARP